MAAAGDPRGGGIPMRLMHSRKKCSLVLGGSGKNTSTNTCRPVNRYIVGYLRIGRRVNDIQTIIEKGEL